MSETRWVLSCYAGDPSGDKLTILVTHGGSSTSETDVSVAQGSSFSAGALVLTMDETATTCVLSMTDTWGDGWGGNAFDSPSLGASMLTLASGSSGTEQVCASFYAPAPRCRAHTHASCGCAPLCPVPVPARANRPLSMRGVPV